MAARSMVNAVTSAALAAGLFAALPPASRAADRHPAPWPAVASRVPGGLGGSAAARLMAAEARLHGSPAGVASYAGAVPGSAPARTGAITGVVRSMAGSPFAGACVSAAGPAGSASADTKDDGRYLLSGLRPGRYALRVLPCARAIRAAGRPAVSLWPGTPGVVAVRAGQVATVAPAMIVQRGRIGLASTNAAAGSKTGSISGVVTGGRRPLRGICADAIPVNGGLIGQARTSRTGRYRIGHLPPGPYQVEFADQFLCQTGNANWLAQWFPGVNNPFGGGIVLHVRAGRHIAGIDGKLKLGGEIAGTVRSKSGRKLAGICVTAIEVFSANGANGEIDDGFSTGQHGGFVLHGLFPGQYTFQFAIGCGNSGNYAFQWWKNAVRESRARVIRISGHKIVRNVDPVLIPGATISGVVKGGSAAGPPLPGVCVYGYDPHDFGGVPVPGGYVAVAVTGGGGHYALQGLATGRYHVTFDPACGNPGPPPINYVGRTRTIAVKAGKSVSGFNGYLERGAILSGTVTDTRGRPLLNVCVQVGDPNGDFATTDQRGAYSIIGIQPGSFTVAFFGGCGNSGSLAPQSYPNQPDPFAASPVRFTSGKATANINAVMQPGGTIAGVVTNDSGHRLGNICVHAATGSFIANVRDVAFTYTSTSRGRYALRNLAPGPYLIQFNCFGGNRYTSPWFNRQADSTTADLLSVNPGVITPASTRLGLAGSIAGTVASKSGFGICVGVDNARNKTPVSLPSDGGLTAHGGRYFIGGLTPGRYLVRFSQCIGKTRYASQWFRDKASAAFATPVTVRAGRTTRRINAAMAAGGSISGRVTSPAGKPLRGMCVEALNAPAQIAVFAETNRAGRYGFTSLATGRYALFLSGHAAGGYPFFFGTCQPVGPVTFGFGRPGRVRVAAPKAVTGINFKLKPTGSVSGRVTAGAPPSPLGGLCVLLQPVNRHNGSAVAFTGTNGRYLASDLPPGKYRAYFNDPSCLVTGGPAPLWYNGQPTETTATDFTVTAGHNTTGINAALEPHGSITGTVTNRTHRGVRGECVTAVPVTPAVDPFDGIPQAAEVAVTTPSGRYALADLAPGRYKVEFTVGCGAQGYATQWWQDAASARSAKVITASFATVGAIDAVLRRRT